MTNQKARGFKRRQGSRNDVRSLNAIDFASRFLEAINTPVSLGIFLCIKHGDYRALTEAGIDPANYTDDLLPLLRLPGLGQFTLDYQAVSLLAKYEDLQTGIDKRAVAERKFISAEAQCKQTNERIMSGAHVRNARVASVLHGAQRKIASILGDVVGLDQLALRFGPGANYGVSGDTSVFQKLNHGLECTYALAEMTAEIFAECPGWFDKTILSADVRLERGSRLTFVPKNAKTDRPICIEPCINTFIQKGYGSYIRSRLKRWGVDLRDQSINQRLAERAIKDDLVTADFSSASDTISYLLVYDLLPVDWATALDKARSPIFEYDNNVYSFQKFSSMGNAYTFELESLIFFALAISCCEELDIPWSTGHEGNLAVYGDDVIMPSQAFSLFSECAETCGFSFNYEKTFSSGLFYESCGHDFFNGTEVRPFFIKRNPAVKRDLGVYYVANQLKRWIQRGVNLSIAVFDLRIPSLLDVYWYVVDHIAESSRLYGPEGFGDGHFVIDTADIYEPHPDGWDGFVFCSRVTMPALITPVLHDDKPEWPMSYALYMGAYGSAEDPVGRHEYDVNWSLLRSQGVSPQFSLGYYVRDRVRVKKAAIYASRQALAR